MGDCKGTAFAEPKMHICEYIKVTTKGQNLQITRIYQKQHEIIENGWKSKKAQYNYWCKNFVGYSIQILTSRFTYYVLERCHNESEVTGNHRKSLKMAGNSLAEARIKCSVHHAQCRVVSVEMWALSFGVS